MGRCPTRRSSGGRIVVGRTRRRTQEARSPRSRRSDAVRSAAGIGVCGRRRVGQGLLLGGGDLASQFHIFSWREEDLLISGKLILRPTVDVPMSLGSSPISQNCLIDAGAPISLLPRGIGIMLDVGMPPEDSKVMKPFYRGRVQQAARLRRGKQAVLAA